MTTKAKQKTTPVPRPVVYPPCNGIIFELTLDDRIHVNDPFREAYCFGNNPKERARGVKGVHTRSFKLDSVYHNHDFREMLERLDPKMIPVGHWIQAFRTKYLMPDGKGPIGIADPYWDRYGNVLFPCVGLGYASSCWIGSKLDEDWRWLVLVVGK